MNPRKWSRATGSFSPTTLTKPRRSPEATDAWNAAFSANSGPSTRNTQPRTTPARPDHHRRASNHYRSSRIARSVRLLAEKCAQEIRIAKPAPVPKTNNHEISRSRNVDALAMRANHRDQVGGRPPRHAGAHPWGSARRNRLLDIALNSVFVGRPPVQPESKAIHRVCGGSRRRGPDQGGGDPRNSSAHPFLFESSPGDQEVAGAQLRARRKVGISEAVSSPAPNLIPRGLKSSPFIHARGCF